MIYISGAITNDPDFECKFNAAECKLNDIFGDCVINPVRLAKALPDYPNLTHGEYMVIAMAALSLCNTMFLLESWQDSKGAQMERDYAIQNGLTILTENN